MITARSDESLDLTIFTGTGTIDARQVMSAMNEFYAAEPTRLVLWEFSAADVTGMSFEDVQAIVDLTVQYGQQRKGGKTAIIAAQQVAFGIGRLYESKLGGTATPVQVHVCWTLEEALEFLGVQALPGH